MGEPRTDTATKNIEHMRGPAASMPQPKTNPNNTQLPFRLWSTSRPPVIINHRWAAPRGHMGGPRADTAATNIEDMHGTAAHMPQPKMSSNHTQQLSFLWSTPAPSPQPQGRTLMNDSQAATAALATSLPTHIDRGMRLDRLELGRTCVYIVIEILFDF